MALDGGFNVISDAMVVTRPKHPPDIPLKAVLQQDASLPLVDEGKKENHFRISAVLFFVTILFLLLGRRYRLSKARERGLLEAEDEVDV